MIYIQLFIIAYLVLNRPLLCRGDPVTAEGRARLGRLLNRLIPISLQRSASATMTMGCLPKWNLKINLKPILNFQLKNSIEAGNSR